MDGIFNVLKPPKMTSHDVIAFLRKALKTKKVGHAGTLDPDAAGVLPVFVGSATRLLEFAVEGRKQYIVEITLGLKTDTGDDSGEIIKKMPVPALDEELLKNVLSKFLGKQHQIPPMYSAIKINGQKLYALARKGIEVERQPREIEIYHLDLLHYSKCTLTIAVECSKGTYIRVLGEDIAAALNTCGTMSFLLRTKVGGFDLETAASLQEIAENPEKYIRKPESAVDHLPKVILTANQANRITSGVRTTVAGTADGKYTMFAPVGEFLGIGTCQNEMIKADKVFFHYNKEHEE